jgi:soluble lytic murein transglycosylase
MKRLLLLLLFAGAAFAVYHSRNSLPAAIRSIEFVIRPVFHKDTIDQYAGIYKEDPLFITAVIKVESKFIRNAKSSKGALGLMQLMPTTAAEIAKELKIKPFRIEQLEDPRTNIQFGTYYVSKLRKEFGNDGVTVLAAYNAGPKNAHDWMKNRHKKILTEADIEFAETRRFAKDVLSTYTWLKKLQNWRARLLRRFT